MTTLDYYCSWRGVQEVDLLKVDVEGLEVEVLQGCERLVKDGRLRSVIFEISLDPLKGTGHTPEGVVMAIIEMGLNIQHISPYGDLEVVASPGFGVPYLGNYLAMLRTRS